MTADTAEEAHSPERDERGLLRLEREVSFRLRVPLVADAARAFVRDVPASLAHADFLTGVRLRPGDPPTLEARLPVNAAVFGVRDVPFASTIGSTDSGATLTPAGPVHHDRAWAEVGGEARVEPVEGGSCLDYALTLTVFLVLPSAERWGTQALLKMVELTAASVLRKVGEHFPLAIEAAAVEAARAASTRAEAAAS